MSITPKPRSRRACPQRCRRDGWTLDRQASFLATLERTGNVRAAAAAAGMNRASAYRFRDRLGGERFRYAWTLALGRRRERLLQDRLAKTTHALARLRVSGKGDTEQHSVVAYEIGKGDTGRETAQHRQPSQACRPYVIASPRSGCGNPEPPGSPGLLRHYAPRNDGLPALNRFREQG